MMARFDDCAGNVLLAGLCHAGFPVMYVYFPLDAAVAMYAITEEGVCAELACVGHEGMVGACSLLGGAPIFNNTLVVHKGACLRMSAEQFKQEVLSDMPTLQWLLRYTQTLITQMAQMAVCNRHHSIDQALSRWLLTNLDRVQGGPLHMTHELMARLMGVRREGITEAASRLQRKGLIRYGRGLITVTDRTGLERNACACYRLVKQESQRLMG